MPRRLTSASGGKFYTDPQGRPYWSVTEILGGSVPKQQALVPWAASMAAECAIAYHDSIGKSLDRGYVRAVRKFIAEACDRKRDRAADLGSLVHRAVECWLTDEPMPPWPAEAEPYMEAFVAFLYDFEPEIVAAELTVYSEDYGYAGRLDLILRLGRLHDLVVLVDTKTGKSVYGREVSLQLAGYRHARHYAVDGGGLEPMPKVDACAVLHLQANGTYSFRPVRTDTEVFDAFLHHIATYGWHHGQAAGVLGENRADGSVGVIGKGLKRLKDGHVPARVLEAWLPEHEAKPWRVPEEVSA